MITLKEFFESKEKLAIHCETEIQSKKLLCAFHRMGKKWYDGDSYLNLKFIQLNGKETCYTNACSYINIDYNNYYKIIEFEEIDDFNFKVGDKVRVRQWEDMVNEYEVIKFSDGTESIQCFGNFPCSMKRFCGEEFTIKKVKGHFIFFVDKYVMTKDMVEKVYEEDKEEKKEMNCNCKEDFEDALNYSLMLARCSGKTGLLSALQSKQFENSVKNYVEKYISRKNDYSFRFNDERKSVTLYENGEKVQFVKPQKEDKFNWKIGLGVAFYKQLYKGNADVDYVKGIVNEKTFYNYCVARFFSFDKDKVLELENHVKNCKRSYCEFQLTKILKGE